MQECHISETITSCILTETFFFLDSSCSTILHSVQDSLSIMLTSAVRVVCPVCVCVCLLWAQCMDPGGCSKGYVWKQGSKMLADPVAIINDSDRPDLTHSITLCLAHHQVIQHADTWQPRLPPAASPVHQHGTRRIPLVASHNIWTRLSAIPQHCKRDARCGQRNDRYS